MPAADRKQEEGDPQLVQAYACFIEG